MGEGDANGPFALDTDATSELLANRLREAVRDLGRRGAVVAISGGIDSSVAAALAVKALGTRHVLCLRLPERDIGGGASDLGLELAEALGARSIEESITGALDGLGCYRRRDDAIRLVFPEYQPDWKHKVVRSAPTGAIITFSLVVERPDGETLQAPMGAEAYRGLIAATNMKQRVRKLLEYTWADQLGYAVIGTPNLLEYDQGFFVKGGDGLADVKPIAGLYKTQVYTLARALGVPASITDRTPTTETFSLAQTQEEFYFGHPYERMDLLLWNHTNAVPAAEAASAVGIPVEAVEAAYWEIERRREATRYLHAEPVLLEVAAQKH